jgi:hypothetical protein
MRPILRVLFILVPLAVLATSLTRIGPPVRAHGIEGRIAEPIVVSGADLVPFHGATWDTLWVYAWDHDDWQFVIGQMDERDAQDQFVAGEDGQLDANDEYVFMADILGQKRPDDQWPGGIGHEHPAIEVQVTDPLVPGYVGYAYLFWSDDAPYPLARPRVTYDAVKRELQSDNYTLGFANPNLDADNFVGVKRLSLYGGERDLLDRLKIRAEITFMGTRSVVDEQQLAALGDQFTVSPVKQGLLRVILDPTGDAMAYAQRATVFGGLGQLGGVSPIPELELHNVRVSLDFAASLGEVRYRDDNNPEGVPVDGMPDTVTASPLPAWRELTFEEGRAVFLRPDPATASAATAYYKDDKTQDDKDTGDYMSYGDNGAHAEKLDDFLTAGFPGQLVVLPSAGAMTAAKLARNLANPLQITITVGPLPPTPTPGGPTLTPTVTRTPSPTSGPTRHFAFLPIALQR